MSNNEIFAIQARRCKRCGGLLVSDRAIQDGYGSCCLWKIRQEQGEKEDKNKFSLFDKRFVNLGDLNGR